MALGNLAFADLERVFGGRALGLERGERVRGLGLRRLGLRGRRQRQTAQEHESAADGSNCAMREARHVQLAWADAVNGACISMLVASST